MHRNHRRKPGKHSPKREGGGRHWLRPPSLVPYRQAYWQRQRSIVRRLMNLERYDEIRTKHYHSILWDIY